MEKLLTKKNTLEQLNILKKECINITFKMKKLKEELDNLEIMHRLTK